MFVKKLLIQQDWTLNIRDTQSVQEYILIGPETATGHPIDTWKVSFNYVPLII